MGWIASLLGGALIALIGVIGVKIGLPIKPGLKKNRGRDFVNDLALASAVEACFGHQTFGADGGQTLIVGLHRYPQGGTKRFDLFLCLASRWTVRPVK